MLELLVCPHCGGGMEYDCDSNMGHCPYCGKSAIIRENNNKTTLKENELLDLIHIKFKVGDFNTIIDDCLDYLKTNPRSYEIWKELGLAYNRKEYNSEAGSALDNAIEFSKGDEREKLLKELCMLWIKTEDDTIIGAIERYDPDNNAVKYRDSLIQSKIADSYPDGLKKEKMKRYELALLYLKNAKKCCTYDRAMDAYFAKEKEILQKMSK